MRRPSISVVARQSVVALVAIALVALAAASPVGASSALTLVRDINPTGASNPTNMTRVGNTLFFAADDGIHGVELWKSDGTATGTKMVKNIRPYGASSSPSYLINLNGTLFFTAMDGKHGNQLWKSDGTKAGTVMVGDDTAAAGARNSYCPGEMYFPPVATGNRLFFFLTGGGCALTVTLYVTDGTPAGTHSLEGAPVTTDDGQGVIAAALGNKLYFVGENWDCADAYCGNYEIWVSDGTDSGTHRLAGSPTADQISFLPAHGENLYFNVTAAGEGPRLWKTDGTKAGTKPLTTAGKLSSAPDQAVLMGTRLYFADGSALWKTNGTAAGTYTIATGQVDWLAGAGTSLFFTRGKDLWRSDGTAIGTKDLGVFGTQWPRQLVGVGNKICFFEQDWDNSTWQLFKSDGTKAGTYPVGGFVNPEATDAPGVAVGTKLFFAADDAVHGAELWSYTP